MEASIVVRHPTIRWKVIAAFLAGAAAFSLIRWALIARGLSTDIVARAVGEGFGLFSLSAVVPAAWYGVEALFPHRHHSAMKYAVWLGSMILLASFLTP